MWMRNDNGADHTEGEYIHVIICVKHGPRTALFGCSLPNRENAIAVRL
jgi:hypothetical protein